MDRFANRRRVTLAIFLLSASVVSAAPIRLHSGSIDFDTIGYGDGPVHLKGSRGFIFSGYAQLAWLDAVDCAYPCDPGETVSVGMRVNGNDLPGFAELDGAEYTDVGGLNSYEQLSLEITGRFKLPRLGTRDERTVAVRGRLEAEFCHLSIPLAGTVCETIRSGTVATVELYKYDEGTWVVRGISYDIVRQ